jgi:hypothetical protein
MILFSTQFWHNESTIVTSVDNLFWAGYLGGQKLYCAIRVVSVLTKQAYFVLHIYCFTLVYALSLILSLWGFSLPDRKFAPRLAESCVALPVHSASDCAWARCFTQLLQRSAFPARFAVPCVNGKYNKLSQHTVMCLGKERGEIMLSVEEHFELVQIWGTRGNECEYGRVLGRCAA